MRLTMMAALVAATACAHVKVVQPRLGTALLLEAHLETAVLKSGAQARVRYVLRNVSAVAVDLCQIEPGVTTTIGTEGRRLPVRGYGMTSGGGCLRVRLQPGEGRELIEDCPVPGAPLGPSELIGFIRVCRPNGLDEATITSVPVAVTITPANTALHPTPAGAIANRRG
jgi:hypothetical protein